MKKLSSKQSKRLRKFNEIKRGLSKQCIICGSEAVDAAHLLPRSLFPEYYTEEWNIVPMCRQCHDRFDNDLSFRQKQSGLYERVKEHDEQAAYRYFKI
jgi:5-methylcytosine-specific restriction endonuclease McrA